MPIGPKKLLKLVKSKKLVEGLDKRELENPEGAGFDLRVGKFFRFKNKKAFLGIHDRQTPDVAAVAEYKNGKKISYKIKPGEYVLALTMESVNLPQTLAAYTFARSTLFRLGLQFLGTQVAPGYQGQLTFGIKNLSNIPVTIELGARIAHIQFLEVDGGGTRYRGQWKGGRVAAPRRERQV